VPKDAVEAYKWYNLASAQGDKDAANAKYAADVREQLAASMTPDQIAEAQKLSTEFQLTQN